MTRTTNRRRRSTTKTEQSSVPEPVVEERNPHPVLTQEDMRDVARLVVMDHAGTQVAEYEPFVPIADIQMDLAKTQAEGRYFIKGRTSSGGPLATWRAVEVTKMEDLGGGFRRTMTEDPTLNEMTFVREQQLLLQKQQDEISKQKQLLEQQQKTALEELQNKREQAQSEHLKVMMVFMENQGKAQSERFERERALQLEFEERKREAELQAQVLEKERQMILEQERSRLAQEREAMHQRSLEQAKLDLAQRIEAQKRQHQLELDMVRAQQEQQVKVIEQISDMKVAKKVQGLESKYQTNLPQSVIEMLWEKKIQHEYPEETSIDKIMRQLSPILAATGILPPGGAGAPGGGALGISEAPIMQQIPPGVSVGQPAVLPAAPSGAPVEQSVPEVFDSDDF